MIINLISSPRNISTAMMYSFAHRSDTKVMDEPFYAYYLHLTDADHPGRAEIIESQPKSIAGVKEWIGHTASQHDVVFIKNMAHHLIQLDYGFMKGYKNVFLIRNPEEIISSFSKVIPNPQMKDIGIEKQLELFNYLAKEHDCPVIDSGEVLKNPEKIIKALCKTLNLNFEPSMIRWKPGKLAEDGVWAKYWYKNVHKSTGFEKNSSLKKEIPTDYQELLDASIPIYNELSKFSIKA